MTEFLTSSSHASYHKTHHCKTRDTYISGTFPRSLVFQMNGQENMLTCLKLIGVGETGNACVGLGVS